MTNGNLNIRKPQDLRRCLERESGKDLSWLFDEIIQQQNILTTQLPK